MHWADRGMIYIFIASSYFPWLSLIPNAAKISTHSGQTSLSLLPIFLSWMGVSSDIASDLRWTIWFLAAIGILYQQIFHEKYKRLEILIYVIIGLVPSVPFLHHVSLLNAYQTAQQQFSQQYVAVFIKLELYFLL